jgi:hypothetical protein
MFFIFARHNVHMILSHTFLCLKGKDSNLKSEVTPCQNKNDKSKIYFCISINKSLKCTIFLHDIIWSLHFIILIHVTRSYSKKTFVNINSKFKGVRDTSRNRHARVISLVTQYVCNDKTYIFEVWSRYLKK